MSRLLLPPFVLAAVLLLTITVGAGEPPQQERLPPPRQAPPSTPPPAVLPPPPVVILSPHPMGLPPVVYTRHSDYEVWQNLGVDRWGRFRPLVIMSPYGDYYRYNGQPYP